MKKQNKCTKETILEEQKRLKKEPDIINVKTWSYVVEQKEEKKHDKKQDYKKKKSTHKKQSRNVK